MIRLAHIIDQFEADFIQQYQHQLLLSQYKALSAIKGTILDTHHLTSFYCNNQYKSKVQTQKT
jgi:hypothetical protein